MHVCRKGQTLSYINSSCQTTVAMLELWGRRGRLAQTNKQWHAYVLRGRSPAESDESTRN